VAKFFEQQKNISILVGFELLLARIARLAALDASCHERIVVLLLDEQ